MKKTPIKYRNLCLVQWLALVLSQILYQFNDSTFFFLIRNLLILCVIISIVNYRSIMEKYIMQGDFKKLVKYQTENGCYKSAKAIGDIRGIVISCTEHSDPSLKRYVDAHNELGFNDEKNHWNYPTNAQMPHDFIGYDKDNNIVVVNTVPYSISSFACGSGEKGTYDLPPNAHLQLNICFMSDDRSYFENAVFGAAVQHCAYLCKKHKLKPDTIISDMEAFNLGFASHYTMLEQWMLINGRTMEDFRNAVKVRLKGK